MKKLIVPHPEAFSSLVTTQIQQVAQLSDREILIGVPGGRGAVAVVGGIVQCPPTILKRVHLYLVDERVTGEKNLDTLLNTGLQQVIDNGTFRMAQIHLPQENQALVEGQRHLELLYVGVGEDGHIASLFPESYPELDALNCPDVIRVHDSPKPPPERLTVTYRGLKNSAKRAQVTLMFFGEGKRIALERFLTGTENPSTLPCRYFPQEWFSVDVVTDIQEVAR
jgi:6-phosphogluconolactonase